MIDSQKEHQKLKITLVSPEQIRVWSETILPNGKRIGEVTNPKTIDLATNKPERNGSFCERIFGPVKSKKCACENKFGEDKKGFAFVDRKKTNDSGLCEHCGVEFMDSRIRRYRMGYIKLASPVTHIWYIKRVPSYIATLIGKQNSEIKDLVYCNLFLARPAANKPTILRFRGLLQHGEITSWMEILVPYISGWNFVEFQERELATGGTSIQKQLIGLNLRALINHSYMEWRKLLKNHRIQKRKNKIEKRKNFLVKRIKFAKNLIQAKINPEWMVLCLLPVLPPELRPIFVLGEQVVVESDFNKLYQKVILRNKNLQNSFEIQGGPFYSTGDFLTLQKRLLQEAVDALLDSGKSGQPRKDHFRNRPYKSFSDVIAGKEGRFRANLLGKRVDYSARSVIVVGPSLALHQCGLPRELAIKLFQPFLIRNLIGQGVVANIRAAKLLIQRRIPVVWKILQQILLGHPVLLNRAPTLHKFGILAFQPILVKERAIRLHPAVCTGFNADFDGDQMAVHLPLSIEAILESRLLMFSHTNLLSPSNGSPITKPTQDMLLGLYILTTEKPRNISQFRCRPSNPTKKFLPEANLCFCNYDDVFIAYQKNRVSLKKPLWFRWKVVNGTILTSVDQEVPIEFQYQSLGTSQQIYEHYTIQRARSGKVLTIYIRTTVGRIIFNREIENAFLAFSKLSESPRAMPVF
uniref:DNA-directed RNA polymerase subunit gamma n=1 Tax=Gnetum parvifolium TaxID=33153 RepID=A0A1B2IKG3_GNEPA|nr:RNA polymerase beta subunit-1 [Gnetum parvifolium]ANZ53842.1 RNA polymerase beta subunit-1 [Gnetum parvifolium]